MLLPKSTRKRLWASKGAEIEIAWPEDAAEPKTGHRYSIQTEASDTESRFLVVRTKERGAKAIVRLDNDPVRGMHIGTKQPSNALTAHLSTEYEPEQVSAQYQRLISEEGQLKTILSGAKHRQQGKKIRWEEYCRHSQQKIRPTTDSKL